MATSGKKEIHILRNDNNSDRLVVLKTYNVHEIQKGQVLSKSQIEDFQAQGIKIKYIVDYKLNFKETKQRIHRREEYDKALDSFLDARTDASGMDSKHSYRFLWFFAGALWLFLIVIFFISILN